MTDHEAPCSGTKTCSKCGRDLPVLAFSVHKKHRDGLDSRCRECARKRPSESTRKDKALDGGADLAFDPELA